MHRTEDGLLIDQGTCQDFRLMSWWGVGARGLI